MADKADASPVSYLLNVSRLPPKGVTVTIDADAVERAALADQHGLLSVECFVAEILARPWKGEGVSVRGKVEADVTQACIVTLDPLVAHVDEEISAIYLPEGSRLARSEHENGEIVVEADSEDLPELFAGDSIDLGALAEEFFALALDPYPRKEGIALELPKEAGTDEENRGPLYEGLRKLREKP